MDSEDYNDNDSPEHDEELYKQKVSELSFIDDVPLQIMIRLGETTLTIQDLLQLQVGSVIELDKLAGEPLDITLKGRSIAKGEVVVINEKFGIRMTDIVG